MGQSLFERIQAKLELFRLEQRYTRRRHRRSQFVSNAVYVDGEYIYQIPNSTGSSTDSNMSRIDALHGDKAVAQAVAAPVQVGPLEAIHDIDSDVPTASANRKRLHRFSSMPGFGGSFSTSNLGPKDNIRIERRTSLIR